MTRDASVSTHLSLAFPPASVQDPRGATGSKPALHGPGGPVPPSRQCLSRSPIMRRLASWLALFALVTGIAALPARIASHPAANPDFVHFESSHVHPASITPDGSMLLVVNTPDNRLTVFDLTTSSPTRIAEIPVGLEPVSVAARTNGEAWVVNNVSDDVSVVDLTLMHVKATLRVGDEPN